MFEAMDVEDFKSRYVQKFTELKELKVGPPDRWVERYKRQRFSVVGRPDERPDGDKGVAMGTDFNIGYMGCEPGKGHCCHAHPGVEVFIVMSGKWEIDVRGVGKIIAEPWDVVSMPPNSFHSATNISDQMAFIMSVNDGTKTAPYTIPADVLAEIAAAKKAEAASA
jgi:quercetin dioxygenase-like cupin family protein